MRSPICPRTLNQTTATLAKVQAFAQQLGPAAKNLLPAANALKGANQALTALAVPGAPIVQNQIRPFVVAARPVVRNLRPAAVNLAAATPNLTKVFGVLNNFVNMVGYNPGNTEHGYLWWLAWLDHNARTLFSVQDANGDFRPLFLQASCASLAQLANTSPLTEVRDEPDADPDQRQPVPGPGLGRPGGVREVRAEASRHRDRVVERRVCRSYLGADAARRLERLERLPVPPEAPD